MQTYENIKFFLEKSVFLGERSKKVRTLKLEMPGPE